MPKGSRACEQCGSLIVLKITRDLTRKRFCGRRCSSLWHYRNNEKLRALRFDPTGIKRPEMWKKHRHPMLGRCHSDETKLRISEAQKLRFQNHPELRPTRERHPMWNGGKTHNRAGYVLSKLDDGRYDLEHRIVMSGHIGRALFTHEQVHHKDGDRTNNHISNLELMEATPHRSMHMKERWKKRKEMSYP